ncbi:MAG: hypothetical protein A2X86_03570 [Bdellovibrionales bacterium GWA2_49_15]|nr:MAG: hypothetical protein A2X86_03570 [Bdellovibrionales bacterium GWA2_49_15]
MTDGAEAGKAKSDKDEETSRGPGVGLDRRLITNITEPSLAILAFVCVTFILVYTKTIAVPFVLAFFLYSALVPLLNWFVAKFKLPRLVVIGLFVVMGPLILLGMILPLIKSVESVFGDIDLYRERLTILATSFSSWLTQKIPLLSMVKWKSSNIWAKIPYENLAHYITDFFINFFVYITLMFIFLFFMIIGGTGIGPKEGLIPEIQHKIAHYLLNKFMISFGVGLISFILYVSLDLDLSFMFGALAFVLNFIPNVGGIIASALPIPVVLLQYGVGWQFYLVLIFNMIFQFLIGNIVEPKVLGDSMELHPIVILVFLMFWGLVWGPIGMFLAVPITAIMRIVFARIDVTRPVAELMSGRLPPSLKR